jgi:FHA domain-containing protein
MEMTVMAMATDVLPVPAIDGITEPFDPVACLSSRDRRRAVAVAGGQLGRYIEVQGQDEGLLIPLGEEVLHVGRGLSVDLQLDDSSVSRRHAIIMPRGSGVRILDDRSLNGTFVNGRRIEHADLRDGDMITVGRFELRYIADRPRSRSATIHSGE